MLSKVKVKFILEQAMKTQRYSSNLSLTSALDMGGLSTPNLGPFTSRKTRYPLYSRLGGLQGRSGGVRKISPPRGFDLRTFQPVQSRCTDWAIQSRECLAVFYFPNTERIRDYAHILSMVVVRICRMVMEYRWKDRHGVDRSVRRRPVYHTSHVVCSGIECDSLRWEVSRSRPDKMAVALCVEPH